MDKRSLLFVVLLAATLFFVNMFFQWTNQDKVREWNEQQLVKKKQKEAALSATIAERTAKAEELPIIELFADKDEKIVLQAGVLDNDNIITVRGTEAPPQTIYSKKQEYTLEYSSENSGDPILYRKKGSKEKLRIGDLPDFGKFDLQVVLLSGQPPKIELGEYFDGIFSYPQYQLDRLRKEIDPNAPTPSRPAVDGIVLFKVGKEFLPIGIYQSHRKDVVYLEEIADVANYVEKPKVDHLPSVGHKEELFFVLENGYQQLVFSNYGGALAEINLPFESKTDQESVVKEIEFDRQMVEKHPYNAHFPAHAFKTPGQDPKGPFAKQQGTAGWLLSPAAPRPYRNRKKEIR